MSERVAKWIKCLRCGMVSYNENDIKHKYCGNCHQFLRPTEYEIGEV